VCQQERAGACASRSQRRLGAGMATTNHYHIKTRRELHLDSRLKGGAMIRQSVLKYLYVSRETANPSNLPTESFT
jgi:hypothetical protein